MSVVRECLTCLLLALWLAVLLLWARSYYWRDQVTVRFTETRGMSLASMSGVAELSRRDLNWLPDRFWHWRGYPAEKFQTLVEALRAKGPNGVTPDLRLGFGLTDRRAYVPHWFLALVIGGLTVLVKPAPRARFGLRQLMIMVAVAAGILGTIVATAVSR